MTDETRIIDPNRQAKQPRPTAQPSRKRRRMSRGQRWVIRLLLLAVILAFLAVAAVFLTDFRMGDAGTLSALSPGSGTYLIEQNTLELRYSDGRVKRFALTILPDRMSDRPVRSFRINYEVFRLD